MSLLNVIEQYDQERDVYVRELEERVRVLEAEKTKLLDQLVAGAQTSTDMVLALITTGALRIPTTKTTTETR